MSYIGFFGSCFSSGELVLNCFCASFQDSDSIKPLTCKTASAWPLIPLSASSKLCSGAINFRSKAFAILTGVEATDDDAIKAINPRPNLLLMLLQLLQRLAVMLNNWEEFIGGEEEEKWIRLLRFETEIGLNSAIEVQSEASS
ncbi:hypothetical protein SDJN02_06743, partial [Cucurbita argyrosperma subsp. argyrosperma]